MKDYVIEINRVGVDHGYNHDVEHHHLSVTMYGEKLSEWTERKIRAVAQAFFPTTELPGSFGRSHPLSNDQLPSVYNEEDKTWTHTWLIKYYKAGND
jgi:hypothetical protein